MISESMRDIASDEELSGDDDDPELLSELQELTGILSVVNSMYIKCIVSLI